MKAEQFITELRRQSSPDMISQYRDYFANTPDGKPCKDAFLGVPMGTVFAASKSFISMPPDELEQMLKSPFHEVKAGALSIMDKQAALKKTSPEQLEILYRLYITHLEDINDWRLVDVSCRYTIGRYLFDKPRDILYNLAKSKNMWQRRIAIISTWYFISKHDTSDTFKIAEILLQDEQELVQKAVGWMLREAGAKNPSALRDFLNKNSQHMPRLILRSAIERLTKSEKEKYLSKEKL